MIFDIVIKNGKIIDGTGNPWYRADIGIKEGKISKIGWFEKASAAKEIDATDLIVCPGFIDIHSHSDTEIFFDNTLQSTIRQGITTCVVGNCGENLAPIPPEKMEDFLSLFAIFAPPGVKIEPLPWNTFNEYLDYMEKRGCVANTAHLLGFSTIRLSGGPGFEDRVPTNEEFECMKSFVAEGMEAGAFGMSTGLIYAPQIYAKTEEIIQLVKTVAKYGGLYFSHIRGEGATVIKAVKEAIEIVEKSGCIGGHIAHHKVAGKLYWGRSRETLRLIEDSNTRGVNVTCDQYPYSRCMTSLITALPPWVHLGGHKKLIERLKNPLDRVRIKKDIMKGIEGWENWIKDGGFESIYISFVKKKWQDVEGKNLTEITRLKKKADEWETLFDILIDENGEVAITIEIAGEDDIRRIMTGRYTMVGTDASGVAPTGVLGYGKPHPRYYGTYPRILGRYVREEGVLTLEDAIRRMTSFPSQRMGLFDRGILREGMWADIVVFDPDKVIDKATYTEPHQFPEGIIHVLVNGEIVVESEEQTEKLPGKILRRPS